MSLLVICEVLGLFANTFTVDEKYSLLNRENLPQPFRMQLSKKQKIFSQFFAPFLKSTSNFEDFEKKMTLTADVFQKFKTPKYMVS